MRLIDLYRNAAAHLTPFLHKKAGGFIVFLFALCIPLTSFADQFTVKSLGDYGNITAMEVTGNYDSDNPDGSTRTEPRQMIASEFYKTHKDEYDFIVIFTNFEF